MNKAFIFAIIFFVAQIHSFAQGCYRPSRQEAMKEFGAKRFQSAKNIFQAMKKCPDKPEKNDIDFWIDKCNQAQKPSTKQNIVSFADRMKLYEENGMMGFNEGMMAVQKKADWDAFNAKANSPEFDEQANAPKVGFVNEQGILVIPCRYEDPDFYTLRFGYRFSEGLAAVIKKHSTGGIAWGFIDKKGHEVVPFEFYDAQFFSEGWAAVVTAWDDNNNQYWQFIDKTGKIVIDKAFYWAGGFSEGLCAVQPDTTELYGYIDRTGQIMIPAIYTSAYEFKDGLAAVRDKAHGYETARINKRGDVVERYQFRPEYLSLMEIYQYLFQKHKASEHEACFEACLAYERKVRERNGGLWIQGATASASTDWQVAYFIGCYYYDGTGGAVQSYEKAVEYWKEAGNNEKTALYNLGICAYYGKGMPQNYRVALDYFEKAKTAGKTGCDKIIESCKQKLQE